MSNVSDTHYMRVPEIWLPIESSAHIDAFQKKLDSLTQATYEELMALPAENTEEIETAKEKFSISVIRTIKSSEVEIILQFYKRTTNLLLLKFARVHAEGFLMQKNGDFKQVEDKVKYDYM